MRLVEVPLAPSGPLYLRCAACLGLASQAAGPVLADLDAAVGTYYHPECAPHQDGAK
jgi:hypothetical protein